MAIVPIGVPAQEAGSSGLSSKVPDQMSIGAAAREVLARGPLVATNVADGFSFAAGGDILASRATPVDPRNRDIVDVLRTADMAMANLEAAVVDTRERDLHPANNGGYLICSPPEVPAMLRDWGIDVVAYANNHAMDWGTDGARDTIRRLDSAGIAAAGFGETRAGARAPAFFSTAKGRVALISFTASFFGGSVAADPIGVIPGVPGLSVLRTTPVDIVTREQFATLRQIDAEHNVGALAGRRLDGDEMVYHGRHFRVGAAPDTVYQMNPDDEADILRNIRQAKQQADFLVVTVHNHEEPDCAKPVQSGDGSAWPCLAPPDFLRTIAHMGIDNGADAIVGHGPHVLQGIEIYRGRPIFYSLGNLFSSLEGVTKFKDALPATLDAVHETAPEFFEKMWSTYEQDSTIFQSVIALSRYRGNQLAEIKLYPIDLGLRRRQADRGTPETPPPAEARAILERLQRLSAPFGTIISIEGSVGVIRIP